MDVVEASVVVFAFLVMVVDVYVDVAGVVMTEATVVAVFVVGVSVVIVEADMFAAKRSNH